MENVTHVTQVTKDIYRVLKDDCEIVVGKVGKIVLIVDFSEKWKMGDVPFVAYRRMYLTNDAAYRKLMHLLGKMCKKDVSSKYFRNHIKEEHMRNGKLRKASIHAVMLAIEKLQEEVL